MAYARLSKTVATLALLLSAALAVQPAAAHPHIWVSVETTVLYENGTIVGFRHDWTFDEYYSSTAVEDLDTDKDGKYSRKELAELAKVNIQGLKEFDYFTFPTLAGQPLALGAPKTFWLSHGPKPFVAANEPLSNPAAPQPAAGTTPAAPNSAPSDSGAARESGSGAAAIAAQAATRPGVLTLHFTLPLAKPVLADAKDFAFAIQDPTFFIAFEPTSEKAVALGRGAPKACRVATDAVMTAPAADAPASKPGDLMASQPSDLAVNIVAPPAYKVVCGAAVQ